MQLLKPRCRIAKNEKGEVLTWLVHGFDIEVVSYRSMDVALHYWSQLAIHKILKTAHFSIGTNWRFVKF